MQGLGVEDGVASADVICAALADRIMFLNLIGNKKGGIKNNTHLSVVDMICLNSHPPCNVLATINHDSKLVGKIKFQQYH